MSKIIEFEQYCKNTRTRITSNNLVKLANDIANLTKFAGTLTISLENVVKNTVPKFGIRFSDCYLVEESGFDFIDVGNWNINGSGYVTETPALEYEWENHDFKYSLFVSITDMQVSDGSGDIMLVCRRESDCIKETYDFDTEEWFASNDLDENNSFYTLAEQVLGKDKAPKDLEFLSKAAIIWDSMYEVDLQEMENIKNNTEKLRAVYRETSSFMDINIDFIPDENGSDDIDNFNFCLNLEFANRLKHGFSIRENNGEYILSQSLNVYQLIDNPQKITSLGLEETDPIPAFHADVIHTTNTQQVINLLNTMYLCSGDEPGFVILLSLNAYVKAEKVSELSEHIFFVDPDNQTLTEEEYNNLIKLVRGVEAIANFEKKYLEN